MNFPKCWCGLNLLQIQIFSGERSSQAGFKSCFLQPAFVSQKTHQLSPSEPEGVEMHREKSYFAFQNPINSRLLPYKVIKGTQNHQPMYTDH